MKIQLISVVIGIAAELTCAAPAPSFTSQQWDVIVVGAGPAGLIMADRLSEAGKRTLLLEAGGPSYYRTGGRDRPSWLDSTQLSRVDVPGLYKSIFADPGNLTCTGQANAFGGCTIGGSSAINAGLFFQPPASDFDTYFPAGWKSADVAGAIGKLLSRQPAVSTTSADHKYYLQSGYDAARSWLVQGAGYREVAIDGVPNNKTKVFGHPAYDYRNGQRGGPVTTYLQTALARKNFQLQHGVRVQRIVHRGGQATGVLAKVNGVMRTIALAQGGRVILSGGALQSPALLYMSGIGPPSTLAVLQSAGKLAPGTTPATWINNTAVGDRLFDNPNTFIELSSPSVTSYTYSYASPPPADESLYLRPQRSGPYTFASQTSVFWDYVAQPGGGQMGMQGTIDSSGFAASGSNPHAVTLNVYGTSGLRSRGHVVLSGPAFLPGPSPDVYYSNAADAAAIATFIERIFAALPKTGPGALTPLNVPAGATHAQLVAYITTYSAYARGETNHWSSSCRLGSCVGAADLLVKGTANVHVVDASIVEPLTVNPQFGVMVAAERAAELILKL